jgi:hypothetical protein
MAAARLDALTVRESNGQSYWTRIGVAFPGRDGSFMVKLDAMPASTEGQYVIHLREPRENSGAGGTGQRQRSRGDDEDQVPF